MASYRNDLESARLRVETLEAKLRERDAELAERDAALAARDAEIAELRAGQKHKRSFFDQHDDAEQASAARSQKRLALIGGAAVVVVLVVLSVSLLGGSRQADEREAAAERAEIAEAENVSREQRRLRDKLEETRKRLEAERKLADAESMAERAAIQRELEEERARKAAGAPHPTAVPMGGATLNINCLPPSTVIVDGKRLGISPVTGHPVALGVHSVVCSHPERGTKARSATAKAGTTTTVAMKL